MEDHILRCNNHSQTRGYCRSELRDVAIVTTCSHVLCEPCAQGSGFLTAPLAQRQCPACNTSLPKPDDAARTLLYPSEEYKTSVLSGLDPSTIMECASRALCFWNYQSLQETAYQKHLLGALNQKYTHLNTEMDKLVLAANAELDSMQSRVSALSTSNTELQRRNTDYAAKDRERTKKFNDLRLMYDKLKQKYQSIVQTDAASAGAQLAVQSMTDTMLPQRHSIGGVALTNVPQSAGGYFSTRKEHDVTGRPFDGAHQQYHHQRGTSLNGFDHELTTKMPPPVALPNRQTIGSLGTPGAQRSGFPNPLNSAVRRSYIGLEKSQQSGQSPAAEWLAGQRQTLSNSNTSTLRQGSVTRHGGLTAGMKVGSASTGDPTLHRFASM